MALRRIVLEGDPVLRKKAREVSDFAERTHQILDDMWETMKEQDGVGLAAPQVGILRRMAVVDVSPPPAPERDEDDIGDTASGGKIAGRARNDNENARDDTSQQVRDNEDQQTPAYPEGHIIISGNPDELTSIELLNPVILEQTGEVEDKEGCLSLPGIVGKVKRPTYIKFKSLDRNGAEFSAEAFGFAAKAVSHEIDHLEGVLFTDKATDIEDVRHREDDE